MGNLITPFTVVPKGLGNFRKESDSVEDQLSKRGLRQPIHPQGREANMKLLAMLMMVADPNGQPLPEVVLLDFHAPYCQPCQQMVPMLQRMERDKYPIRKIDITEHPDVSKQYNVDRIPTLILLVNGQEAQRFVGLTAEGELRTAMNQAARELDEQRKAHSSQPASDSADGADPIADSRPSAPAPGPGLEAPPSGLRGIFERMKNGLAGKSSVDSIEHPSYRAQSTDAVADTAANRTAMQATVRVRLIDGKMRDFGTGTIVHSTSGQSTILTCAHVFKGVSSEAAVVVDVFRDGQVSKYPATVIAGDHNSDVAFLTIKNSAPLTAAPIAKELGLRQSDGVFSIGCNNGDVPTRLDMNVVAIDRYEGPENIVCTKDPIRGRSGGALFNTSGEVVGVCSGAFRKAQEGLYSGVKPILQLAGTKKLSFLVDNEATSFQCDENEPEQVAEVDNPFAADDALFDELMSESAADFSNEDSIDAPDFAQASPGELSDPFAPANSAISNAGAAANAKLPTEITVIIDSQEPGKEKRVVVIPKPSPWLLRLLTGDATGAGNSVSAGGTAFSSTGARRTRANPPTRPRVSLAR